MSDVTGYDLAKYRIEKAKECLQTAKFVYGANDYLTVLNRSYYAIFHAIRAILAVDGVDRRKHSGVIAYFQQHYVKSGIFSKEYSTIVQDAFEVRQESDYEDFYVISKEEAEIQLANAGKFVETVDRYLQNISK